MKKKLLLSCMALAMAIGLVPQTNTTVQAQANNNFQGSQFEQGAYDSDAEFSYGLNWSENSPYKGTDKMEVKWKFDLESTYLEGRPVIGKDGALYLTTSNKDFYAVNKDGSLNWVKKGKRFAGVPVIGADGTVYTVSGDGYYSYLDAYNPDGSLKWQTKLSTTEGSKEPIAIDKDGTIYVGTANLDAFNSDGSLKWKTRGGSPDKIIISREGLIHTLTTSTTGSNGLVYTYDKNGVEKWRMEVGSASYKSDFTLGADGDIYYNEGTNILIISSDGKLKHKWKMGGTLTGAPTISEKDGTVYQSADSGLIALNSDGTNKWFNNSVRIVGAITIDMNGIIYGLTQHSELVALNPDGTLKSKMKLEYAGPIGNPNSRLTIGKDGTIYTIGKGLPGKGVLTAIGDPNPIDPSCLPPKGYLESLEEKIKTNDLTDAEKKQALERLNATIESIKSSNQ